MKKVINRIITIFICAFLSVSLLSLRVCAAEVEPHEKNNAIVLHSEEPDSTISKETHNENLAQTPKDYSGNIRSYEPNGAGDGF